MDDKSYLRMLLAQNEAIREFKHCEDKAIPEMAINTLLQQYSEVILWLDQSLIKQPDNPNLWYAKALLSILSNQDTVAEAAFAEMARLNPVFWAEKLLIWIKA